MGIQITRIGNDFDVNITGAESAEQAQKGLSGSGSDDEKVVAFITPDLEDPGVQAIVAVLMLAVEEGGHNGKIGAESLLLEIFMAGRNSVTQQD